MAVGCSFSLVGVEVYEAQRARVMTGPGGRPKHGWRSKCHRPVASCYRHRPIWAERLLSTGAPPSHPSPRSTCPACQPWHHADSDPSGFTVSDGERGDEPSVYHLTENKHKKEIPRLSRWGGTYFLSHPWCISFATFGFFECCDRLF